MEITVRAKPSKLTVKEGPAVSLQLELYGQPDLNNLAAIHGRVCDVTIEYRDPEVQQEMRELVETADWPTARAWEG